ncbi:hypothetical protein [Vannielia sp.]|uniref:hypothetical protein n=1 Tax=Vannielia sp. TaxID=2813045 RepID=UPI002610433C|nr:hypothetical protein [Vannielia sp.]MDF1873852.1 hypothetical protein [Vannielia sp.]
MTLPKIWQSALGARLLFGYYHKPFLRLTLINPQTDGSSKYTPLIDTRLAAAGFERAKNC